MDGDGYIEVSSGVSDRSRIRHTRLSVIYVLPHGTNVPDDESIFSGAMNSQCVWHIDVGATPEQGPKNQDYDKSDLGFARLKLRFGATVPPTRPEHIGSEFRRSTAASRSAWATSLTPFATCCRAKACRRSPRRQVRALQSLSPDLAEQSVRDYWTQFFDRAAGFEFPDPVLNDIFPVAAGHASDSRRGDQ